MRPVRIYNQLAQRLSSRKAAIEARIQEELKRPAPDSLSLQGLKRLRLSVKDRLNRLNAARQPALAGRQ